MNNGIGQFIVNDTVYKYTELAPIEALAFGAKCIKTLGPLMSGLGGALSAVSKASQEKASEGAAPSGAIDATEAVLSALAPMLVNVDESRLMELFKECFGHVFTPQNECLGDEAAFNAWFMERKADLFPVGIVALIYLGRDFFPKLPATSKAA